MWHHRHFITLNPWRSRVAILTPMTTREVTSSQKICVLLWLSRVVCVKLAMTSRVVCASLAMVPILVMTPLVVCALLVMVPISMMTSLVFSVTLEMIPKSCFYNFTSWIHQSSLSLIISCLSLGCFDSFWLGYYLFDFIEWVLCF